MVFKRKFNLFAEKKYRINRPVRFNNPLKIKKGLAKFKLFKLLNLILFVGILSCLYFFIFSDFYQINSIEVSGNQIISTEDILDITYNYFGGKRLLILNNGNIFVFSKKELTKRINDVVLLQNITIDKILPNTIKINIKEKNAALKWITNDQQYLIDNEGLVIKRYYNLVTPQVFKLTNDEPVIKSDADDGFIVLSNLANEKVNLGDKVLNPDDIKFIFDLLNELPKYNYLAVKSYYVPNNFPRFLIVETTDNWQIFFNLVDSLSSQLNRLDILAQDKIKKENLPNLEYIDLRYGESLYYK
jgi:cell division septal protein FtsQ